jgi:hypothetical protein
MAASVESHKAGVAGLWLVHAFPESKCFYSGGKPADDLSEIPHTNFSASSTSLVA